MDANQKQAFLDGTGGTFSTVDTAFFFTGLLSVGLLVWCGWTAIKAYQGFASEELTVMEAGGMVARSIVLMTVLLFMISWG